MRQVVLTAPKQIEFREVAAPEAGNLKSDEVLLRILRIGICGSRYTLITDSIPPPSIRWCRGTSIRPRWWPWAVRCAR